MVFAEGTALDHVLDTYVWHFFDEPFHFAIPLSFHVGGYEIGISKYTLIMILAAALVCWIYIPLAKKIQNGEAPTGIFWNLFESILTFVRDNIAKPYIGKDADKYVPFVWTMFLFVLFCNLFGMVPFFGSPTASFTVAFVLAGFVFFFIHVQSIRQHGFKAHMFSFAPAMDLPIGIKIPILIMLWPIEFGGLILKCFVLAVRLFANMFAGHIVLGTILLFIPMVVNTTALIQGSVTFASVLGVLALSFLELFVAFLQAFLFAFLTALFFGGVLEHAEHAAGHGDHGHGEHGHGEHAHDESHAHPAAEKHH